VKVQAKANASIDMSLLEDELFYKLLELQFASARAEAEVWERVRSVYESQQVMRSKVDEELDRVSAIKMELQHAEENKHAALTRQNAMAKHRRQEHELTTKGFRQQQTVAAKELMRLRGLASTAGVEMPEQAITSSATGCCSATASDGNEAREKELAADEASRFGAARLRGARMTIGQAEVAALQAAGCSGQEAQANSGREEPDDAELARLEQGVELYQNAVEKAWADVQRIEDERQQVDRCYQESQEAVERLDREREDMEATLHEVASDLGRLALLYRTQGQAPHAVPLYMTALAIYEKTLGPDHPEVAKDLVNLGNAFCDQNQHEEAVPLYLRALAIDQAALGDDHPEVAMDLSNLGIVYRVQGRRDEAIALFQRAQMIMSDALGPNDPKTLTVARNLAATQVIQVDVVPTPRGPPAALAQRLSQQKKPKTEKDLADELRHAQEKRDAVLRARVDKAVGSTTLRTPRGAIPGSDELVISHDRQTADCADEDAMGPSRIEQVPKLKLPMADGISPAESSFGSATPRSTYSSTSKAAREAADRSRGSGSARSMLHHHVAKMRYDP